MNIQLALLLTIDIYNIVASSFTFQFNYEDTLMKDLYKDILTGAVFVAGMLSFVSGEFIVSSALFASAAIFSSMNASRKKEDKAGQFSCES
jgi:hypothetical protein